MRWAQVSETGEYTSPAFPQISYATLINERVLIIRDSISYVQLGSTIAVRYSAIRRQGENDEQILYYQSQKYRVIPMLATFFAYHFASNALVNQLKILWENMSSNQAQSLGQFPDLHAVSSCMKAFSTWWVVEALEQCRHCLGGHGYSSYSAIPSLLADIGVYTTGGFFFFCKTINFQKY